MRNLRRLVWLERRGFGALSRSRTDLWRRLLMPFPPCSDLSPGLGPAVRLAKERNPSRNCLQYRWQYYYPPERMLRLRGARVDGSGQHGREAAQANEGRRQGRRE